MTAHSEFKQVSENEFKQFIRDYPYILTRDICGISEPPLVSFNDFRDGIKWPESMVAKFHDGDPRVHWVKQ